MHMLKRLRFLLVLLVGLPVALGNSSPRELAALVRAREVLGAESWAAALQLKATQPGRADDNALVFEFAGALWFYRPVDGTQSLSRHWNNVAADRERLLELLQGIDPTYQDYREYTASELATVPMLHGELPNGCFIESAGEARRLARGAEAVNGCLLSYYVRTKDGLRGHTVLCYENTAGTHVYDPAVGRAKKVKPFSVRDQAMELARRIVPDALTRGLAKAAKIMVPAMW
jgi:hypothetical protein